MRNYARMQTFSNIEIKPAPSGGLGLFARADIQAGEFIHTVEYEREITEQHPLNPDHGERADHCAYPDGKIMLVASPGRYMNHSCDPNAYYRYAGQTSEAFARRLICRGEEITVDYLINNPGGDSWACRCGTSRCRGKTGTTFFELPIDFQREYYPLLAEWFRRRFPKEIAELERGL